MAHRFAFAEPPRRLVSAWKRRGAVGVIAPSYGTEKISYGLAPAGHTFHKVTRLPLHRLERDGTFWENTPVLFDHSVELVHTFNELPLGIRPFVVSYEMEMPRYLGSVSPWQMALGYRLLAGDRCRAILALSEAAASGLRHKLNELCMPELVPKVGVFRGTVMSHPVSGEAVRGEPRGRPLKVLFVGRYGFRKGLIPTLNAIEDCRLSGLDVEATVVCNFEPELYVSKVPVDTQGMRNRVRSMPGVVWHDLLPNRDVHRLMQSHDVLLFPSLDESLGWVAVEAAFAGMPVVTTDIFALPEIVRHGETGIVIPLRKDESLRWNGLRLDGAELEAEVEGTFATIRQHVAKALRLFADDPSRMAEMGRAARVHIESLYGFSRVQQQLAGIYAHALGR